MNKLYNGTRNKLVRAGFTDIDKVVAMTDSDISMRLREFGDTSLRELRREYGYVIEYPIMIAGTPCRVRLSCPSSGWGIAEEWISSASGGAVVGELTSGGVFTTSHRAATAIGAYVGAVLARAREGE